MSVPLRVALFSDSHYEANGVARTTGALERYASRRNLPLLSVHAGSATRFVEEGSIVRLELARLGATSFRIEHDLSFDMAMWRHAGRVRRTLARFCPDVLHFTGPSDIGQIGAWLGYRLGIPMVGSWHTNLHEYAARRLKLDWLPAALKALVRRTVERRALEACLLFYKIPRIVLAPNDELLQILHQGSGRPVFSMSRGVDVEAFTPAKRTRTDDAINIGYVGRLSPEKSVRVLAAIDAALARDRHAQPIRFTIIGDGDEREWLRRQMPSATFTGVLRGEDLAGAYADMDLFVFPSQTETVGNVVLEAMASGLAVVAMAQGGPRFVTGMDESVALAQDHDDMLRLVRLLLRDRARRDQMRAAARAWTLRRSWDAIFDGVYRAYACAAANAGTTAVSRGEALVGDSPCVES